MGKSKYKKRKGKNAAAAATVEDGRVHKTNVHLATAAAAAQNTTTRTSPEEEKKAIKSKRNGQTARETEERERAKKKLNG
jgi:hypothetical protein